MKVGFTGTQQGMTDEQRLAFRKLMRDLAPVVDEFRHGDCKGSDEQSHNIVYQMHPVISIVVHPPKDDKKRAWCGIRWGVLGINTSVFEEPDHIDREVFPGVTILPEKDYLVRNHDIVDAIDLLVATPAGPEIVRSGTWATVRYARSKNVPVVELRPHGGRFIA